jgi:hypothetical protein
MNWNYPNRLWHRRDLLEAIAATAIAAPAILRGETARTAHRIIKIDNIFNLVVCENKTAPEIPVQAKLNLLS